MSTPRQPDASAAGTITVPKNRHRDVLPVYAAGLGKIGFAFAGFSSWLHLPFARVAPAGNWLDWLRSMGAGTGVMRSPTGHRDFDFQLAERMRTQDMAVLCLLLLAYLATLVFGWLLVYRMTNSSSEVCYYCDPRFHAHASPSRDPGDFVRVFNGPPKAAGLTVSGFRLAPPGTRGDVSWRGKSYTTAFHFTLDLGDFLDTKGTMRQDEKVKVHRFLRSENSLESLRILKQVSWEGWEELATNVRLRIRQDGFEGPIDVRLFGSDELRVFRNHQWANFMYNSTTKTLFMLSFVGYLFYVPYMSLRARRDTVHSKFNVKITAEDFWKLISDGLCRTGFHRDPASAVSPSAGPSQPH